MIDAHIHIVPSNLPGAGHLHALLLSPPEVLAPALRQEMQSAGVTHALAMGCWQGPAEDPLGVAGTLRVAQAVPGVLPIGIADPTRSDPEHLSRVETVLATGQVRALKAYLGYLH